jgi:hypothetical protein
MECVDPERIKFARKIGRSARPLTYKAGGLISATAISAMLPYNVIVQDVGNGQTEVAAIDPEASLLAIDNPALKTTA